MAKKSNVKYISKGQRPNVRKGLRPKYSFLDKEIHKWNAFLQGKKVFFVIDNPNPNQTNKRKIRVEGKELYGDFRKYNEYYIIRDA